MSTRHGGAGDRHRCLRHEVYDRLPQLFPHYAGAREIFANSPDLAGITAMRNGTLQGGYFILAARALGLDCGPMSGFDNAKVDAEFFAGEPLKSNFLCNMGYGDASKLPPAIRGWRSKRLAGCCKRPPARRATKPGEICGLEWQHGRSRNACAYARRLECARRRRRQLLRRIRPPRAGGGRVLLHRRRRGSRPGIATTAPSRKVGGA